MAHYDGQEANGTVWHAMPLSRALMSLVLCDDRAALTAVCAGKPCHLAHLIIPVFAIMPVADDSLEARGEGASHDLYPCHP